MNLPSRRKRNGVSPVWGIRVRAFWLKGWFMRYPVLRKHYDVWFDSKLIGSTANERKAHEILQLAMKTRVSTRAGA